MLFRPSYRIEKGSNFCKVPYCLRFSNSV